ncbi:MAG TPA: hypothetical protein VL574_14665 [Stellaceae bacterium]|nr:hypothetical protein [Stellaceae bacterium]
MIGSSRVILVLASWLLLAPVVPALALDEGENFLVPIPHDFSAGPESVRGGLEMSSFLPDGESAAGWSEMISLTGDSGMAGQDPAQFAADEGARWRRSCPGGTTGTIADGFENGYKIAIWEYACPATSDSHQPETIWLKAIGGTERLYAARFIVHAPPSDRLAQQAIGYLRYVGICDTRGEEHPCPADGQPPTLPPPPTADVPIEPGPDGASPVGRPVTGATPIGADPIPAQVTPVQNTPAEAMPTGASNAGAAPTSRQVAPN